MIDHQVTANMNPLAGGLSFTTRQNAGGLSFTARQKGAFLVGQGLDESPSSRNYQTLFE